MSELKRKSCVGRQLDYLDYLFGAEVLPYSRGRYSQPGSDHFGVGGAWRLGLGMLELSSAYRTTSGLTFTVALDFASRTAMGLFGGGWVTGGGSSSGSSTRGGSFRHSLLG